MSNIREVAKRANVSITTVSRIINNDPNFHTTPCTKKAVMKAIKDLNYKPNRKVKMTNIGCILSISSEKYADPFFTTILSVCEKEAEKQNIIISQVRHYSELNNPLILNEFINSGLEGLIVMERLPEDMLKTLNKSIPHIINIDYEDAIDNINTVGYDHRFANSKVFNYLIECGYKRIAVIAESSPLESYDNSERLVSYREALRKNNIPYDSELIRDCKCDVDECIKQARELMKLKNPPDVIFAASDSLASATISELQRLGYNCPKDIGVMGFNNLPISTHTNPSLTTLEIPMADIGRKAISRLVELMNNKDNDILKISFPTKLIIRESTRRSK